MSLATLMRSKGARAALAAAVALSAVIGLRAVDPPAIAQMRERTFDGYQQLRPRAYEELPVRIVDIDEASLAKVGQWPWSRDIVASLVKRLAESGAAVIAFDVTFAEPDRSSPHRVVGALAGRDPSEAQQLSTLAAQLPDYDKVFSEAIAGAPVVLGFAAVRAPNPQRPDVKAGFALAGIEPAEIRSRFTGSATNLPLLEQAAAGVGGLNLSSRDVAGIVRRVPMVFTDGGKVYPSLVTEALRVAQQQKSVVVRGTGASGEMNVGARAVVDLRVGQFTVPLTGEGEIFVYFDRDRPERYLPAADVLDPEKAAAIKDKVEGHIVFVGTSAAGLHDSWPTPLGGFVPGVSAHAQATEQILSQTFLYRPDWTTGAEILAMAALALVLTGLLLAFGARAAVAVGAVVLALGVGGSWLAFRELGLLLDPVYPLLGAFGVYFAVVGVLYVATDKEKKFVRRAFGQYVAPELLAKLEHDPEAMRLGGEMRTITLMFMDVRGFTPISECLTAAELVEFMNGLLSPLTDTIQAELGTVDKYIGDAIMAFWNAPLDIPDHPVRACRAALGMRAVVARMNAEDAFGLAARGLSDPKVKIGIGLNTGVACVGNMGSQRRFNYSAMGDAVNTTSRIESNSKEVGFDIVISEETAKLVPGFAMLQAGDYELKGKSQAVRLYALMGDETVAAGEDFQALARHHRDLIQALADDRPAEAEQALAQCRELGGALTKDFYAKFVRRIGRTGTPAETLAAAG